MRLRAIRVQNFRGISSSEVELEPSGVHILEGPNEAGKSSLAQAVDWIFDELDSTKKQAVRAAQPMGRDVGPEVEVEVETGAYRFRYYKRFLKAPKTELEIFTPKPEALTGREAHERVQAILADTMDLDLWKALRIEQGSGALLPRLNEVPSLLEALGSALGNDTDGNGADLMGRVREVYTRFFTEKQGRETKLLLEAGRLRETADERVRELRTDHDALETAVLQRDALSARIQDLHQQHRQAARELKKAEARRHAAQALVAEVERLDLAHTAARTELTLAQKEQQERLRLVEDRDRTADELKGLGKHTPAIKARADGAKKAWAETETALKEVRNRLVAAEEQWEERRRDEAVGNWKREHSRLRSQSAAAMAAEMELATAEQAFTRAAVSAEVLRRLETLRSDLDAAVAAVRAGTPEVELENLGPSETSVEIDGTPVTVEPGKSQTKPVDGVLEVTLPELLRIRVRAGEDRAVQERALAEASAAWKAACGDAGVTSLDDARAHYRLREEAQARKRAAESWLKNELGGTTQLDLEEQMEALRKRIDDASGDAGPETELSEVETARRREESEAGVREVRSELVGAEGARDEARKKHDEANADREEHIRAERTLLEKHAAVETVLAASLGVTPDNALATKLKIAQKKVMEIEETVYAQREALVAEDPGAAESSWRTWQEKDTALDQTIREAEREERGLEAHLQLRGEEGLFEKLETEQTRLAALRDRETALRRQAEATRLLYTVLTEERDAARTRYAVPLRERIEVLGGWLLGPTFSVELDQDLRISHRRLDGITLPFSELSMGAKEQLAVIVRLAAAELVSEGEGVPVMLDDTLGMSDASRLRSMNEILNAVGSGNQVIVFTSFPERYRHVRDALRVTVP